jgi:lipoate-protein ligase B
MLPRRRRAYLWEGLHYLRYRVTRKEKIAIVAVDIRHIGHLHALAENLRLHTRQHVEIVPSGNANLVEIIQSLQFRHSPHLQQLATPLVNLVKLLIRQIYLVIFHIIMLFELNLYFMQRYTYFPI